jgi:integrase
LGFALAFLRGVFRLLTVRRAPTHGKPSTLTCKYRPYAYKKKSPYAILKRFADDLALLPLQARTQKSYWACLRQLSEYYNRSPEIVTPEQLRKYFIYLKTERGFSRQSSTQALCAIKLFWEKTLQRTWPKDLEFARATPEFKLPVILSAGEVRTILAKVPLLDHRVALTTIYSCGLRLGEALKLEVGDIDSKRMFLHIRAGKGNRDRYVPLPQRTLELLRQVWRSHRHPRFVFPAKGRNGLGAPTATEPMDRSTLQGAFRLALRASGIKKAAHIHTLRQNAECRKMPSRAVGSH